MFREVNETAVDISTYKPGEMLGSDAATLLLDSLAYLLSCAFAFSDKAFSMPPLVSVMWEVLALARERFACRWMISSFSADVMRLWMFQDLNR